MARQKGTHVRSDITSAARYEPKECRRAVEIQADELVVISRRYEHTEREGETEDNLTEETKVFHREFYHATPCPWDAWGADGSRVPNGASRCQPESSAAAAMRVQEAWLAERRGGSGPEEAVFTKSRVAPWRG
jgi:hypothetical protein